MLVLSLPLCRDAPDVQLTECVIGVAGPFAGLDTAVTRGDPASHRVGAFEDVGPVPSAQVADCSLHASRQQFTPFL